MGNPALAARKAQEQAKTRIKARREIEKYESRKFNRRVVRAANVPGLYQAGNDGPVVFIATNAGVDKARAITVRCSSVGEARKVAAEFNRAGLCPESDVKQRLAQARAITSAVRSRNLREWRRRGFL